MLPSNVVGTDSEVQSVDQLENSARTGRLIINADDWGRDRKTTDCTLDCVRRGTVSSVSAMVFMEDSERAAEVGQQHAVDAGLHLNLTTPFTGTSVNRRIQEQQQRIAGFLRVSKLCSVIYHPGLTGAFEYVVRAQVDEYERLFGMCPQRLDGHHHMHLCANVQMQRLLPEGTIARRHFSFSAREKSALNRFYRSIQDRQLQKRHRTTDYFFSILPLESGRLARILGLGRQHKVEIETHPVNTDEFKFLTGGKLRVLLQDICVATRYAL